MNCSTLTLSEEHRIKFKTIASGQNKTMKAMLHEWIDAGCPKPVTPSKIPVIGNEIH